MRIMRSLALVLAVALVSGCVTTIADTAAGLTGFKDSKIGTKIDDAAIASLKKGKTTYRDVVSRFGEPSETKVKSDGTKVVTYFSQEQGATTTTTLANGAAQIVPIPGVASFVGGEYNVKTMSVELVFRNDILIDYSVSHGGSKQGSGLIGG